MSILAELNTLLSPVLPVETGVFSGVPPDEYLVLTPMTDEFALFGDNMPLIDVSEVRISLFTKGFTVTDRRYIGHEDDTGYHHYAIDVAKHCELKEE